MGLSTSRLGADATTGLAILRRAGFVLFSAQLVGILCFSTFQYSRFAVAKDFALYSQAWWSIGHGHLNPFSTVVGTSFWRNDAEFVMWPLSLLYHIYPNPIVLLWIQAAAIVATEWVVFSWVLEVLGGSPKLPLRSARLITIGVGVALVIDPWAYETTAFDFHPHVIAAFFVLLAGHDLWAGKLRRLWFWVPLALLCCAPSGLYVVGVGISGILAGRRTRPYGFLLVVVGLAYTWFLTALGGDGVGGQGIAAWYSYLTGSHEHPTFLDIVSGVFRHPRLVTHMIADRWAVLFEFAVTMGLIGVVSPWGIGPMLMVFTPSLLNASPAFLKLAASFQSWSALPFILVGSVMLLTRLLTYGHWTRRIAVGVIATWVTAAVAVAASVLPTIGAWIAVDAPAAAQLARVWRRLPPTAEVISDNGLAGRFGDRQYLYVLGYWRRTAGFDVGTTIPVDRSVVVLIVSPSQGLDEPTPSETRDQVAYIERRLKARTLVARSGIYAFEWRPHRGTERVSLP
jgi:uncharacterized membrane protein